MTNTNEVTMDMLQNMPDYDAILEGKIIPPHCLDIMILSQRGSLVRMSIRTG